MKTSSAKFALGIAACCASLGISAYSIHLSRPERSGLLLPSNPVHDFGELLQGATVAATFELLNDSNAIINITDIMPSCDCLDATLTRRTLKPAETSDLRVTWATRNKRNAARTVIILKYEEKGDHSPREGARSQTAMVHLTANVSPDFVCDPESMVFLKDKKQSMTVSVKGHKFPGTRLLDAACIHRAFRITPMPDKNKILIDFDPGLWSDDVGYAELSITTNSPNDPVYRAPLLVRDPKGSRVGVAEHSGNH